MSVVKLDDFTQRMNYVFGEGSFTFDRSSYKNGTKLVTFTCTKCSSIFTEPPLVFLVSHGSGPGCEKCPKDHSLLKTCIGLGLSGFVLQQTITMIQNFAH